MNIDIRQIEIDNIDDDFDNARFTDEDGRIFNSAYDDLRESIVSTQGRYLLFDVYESEHSPGRYKLFKGGTTRLAITKELSMDCVVEGVENPYLSVRCMVSPKVSASKGLLLGVGENITRGQLCYGEKSIAMHNVLRAYSMEHDEQKVDVEAFVEYAKINGMRALVGNKREYHYLKGCAEYFIFPKVLNKRIIDGRANREWVRGVLTMRGRFIDQYTTNLSENDKDIAVNSAIEMFNSICQQYDSETLTLITLKEPLKKAVLDVSSQSSDIETTYSNSFDQKFDLEAGDVDSKLNGDVKHNALVLVGELVRTGNIEGSSKKTRRLKGMDVRHNEISGFVDLIKLLPKPAKKLALKELFG